MIAFLQGILVSKEPGLATVDVNGVGYEVHVSLTSFERLPAPGQPVRLLTHLHVREDSHTLYGFVTQEEREMFRMLIDISGIGPRLALNALSGLSVRELRAAVAQGDVKRVSSVPGIGRKTAERLIVELRDKISAGEALEALSAKEADTRLRDVMMALVNLGYKQAEARQRVQEILPQVRPDMSFEDILRKALSPR